MIVNVTKLRWITLLVSNKVLNGNISELARQLVTWHGVWYSMSIKNLQCISKQYHGNVFNIFKHIHSLMLHSTANIGLYTSKTFHSGAATWRRQETRDQRPATPLLSKDGNPFSWTKLVLQPILRIKRIPSWLRQTLKMLVLSFPVPSQHLPFTTSGSNDPNVRVGQDVGNLVQVSA